MSPILPGSAVGVLGSGQLGRMFALAARRMGYRVHTYSPDTDTPTGQVADVEISASYDDLENVRNFAESVDVVTFEFENVPSATVEAMAALVPVRPGGHVLHTTQNRLREKNFLRKHGLPVTDFRAIGSRSDLDHALAAFGGRGILKTAGFGYDGKGQWSIASISDADTAWTALDGEEAVLEAFVDFAFEVSVVGARGVDGEFVHYGPVRNTHSRHILDVTVAPAPGLSPKALQAADEITRTVFEALDVVGVLCVEMFVLATGELLINELAPRPHNSGHWTIDGCVCSQFEQQLRAICGLPLGSVRALSPAAAMANLLGDVWEDGEPDWAAALAMPEVHLHLYGKDEARAGRKMGHLTALAETPDEAEHLVREAREALCPIGKLTNLSS